MNIPAKITNGDSATWTDIAASVNGKTYDSSYALTYIIRGPKTLSLTATASGSGWSTTITTTQSATLDAGAYWWAAFASKGSERVQIGSGTLTVMADLTAAGAGYVGTTQSEKDLAALDAEITARLNGGTSYEYTIGNRSLKKEPLRELRAMRAELLERVRGDRRAERIANGQGNPSRTRVRFL